LKAIGGVVVSRVVKEGLSSNGSILLTSGEAKERLRTNSRVVGTGGDV
jgi:hypothetical protein